MRKIWDLQIPSKPESVFLTQIFGQSILLRQTSVWRLLKNQFLRHLALLEDLRLHSWSSSHFCIRNNLWKWISCWRSSLLWSTVVAAILGTVQTALCFLIKMTQNWFTSTTCRANKLLHFQDHFRFVFPELNWGKISEKKSSKEEMKMWKSWRNIYLLMVKSPAA